MKRIGKLIIFFLLLSTISPEIVIRATDIVDIPEFNDLNGDAEYLGQPYRNNYHLDLEHTGILDSGSKMINDIANILFDLIKNIAYLVVTVFYFAMDFDIGALFSDQINGIQKTLNNGVFEPLFTLAFCGTAFVILKKMLRRDTSGIIGEFAKTLGVIILSFLVVEQSGAVLSAATNITKDVCVDALIGVNKDMGVKKTQAFAADAAGILWVNLVHSPWKSMQFGNQIPDNKTIKNFLSSKIDSDERNNLIKNWKVAENETSCFDKNRGGTRISFILMYIIPFIIKSAIFLLVALAQLGFQLLAIFYILCTPIILLLTLLPTYGTDALSNLGRKILESQLNILIITIIMGLLIQMDSFLYSLAPKYGWLIISIFQIAIAITIYLNRNKILGMLSNTNRAVSSPAYLRSQMIQSGNLYKGVENLSKGRHLNKVNRSQVSRSSTSINTQNGNETGEVKKRKPIQREVINTSTENKKDSQDNSNTVNKSSINTTDINGETVEKKVERPKFKNVVYMDEEKKRIEKEKRNPDSSKNKTMNQIVTEMNSEKYKERVAYKNSVRPRYSLSVNTQITDNQTEHEKTLTTKREGVVRPQSITAATSISTQEENTNKTELSQIINDINSKEVKVHKSGQDMKQTVSEQAEDQRKDRASQRENIRPLSTTPLTSTPTQEVNTRKIKASQVMTDNAAANKEVKIHKSRQDMKQTVSEQAEDQRKDRTSQRKYIRPKSTPNSFSFNKKMVVNSGQSPERDKKLTQTLKIATEDTLQTKTMRNIPITKKNNLKGKYKPQETQDSEETMENKTKTLNPVLSAIPDFKEDKKLVDKIKLNNPDNPPDDNSLDK